MFSQLSNSMKATLFYAIAFTLVLVVALFGQRLGELSAMLSMCTSLAAVLIMLLVVTPDGYSKEGWKALALHKAGWSQMGLAILAPFVVMASTYIIVWITGIGHFAAGNFPGIVDLLLSLFMSCALGMAEEIGWRGYLLPHLLPMGRMQAMLLSGLLHGIWHLPLIFLTPFYHPDGNRLIVVGLFLLTLTAAGVLYGYLRLSSESVWPVGIAHGIYNLAWNLFSSYTVAGAAPLLLVYLASESGLIPLIVLVILTGWLVYRWQRQPEAVQPPNVLAGERFA